jgi:LPXTG-motif cell wall-anchored protein
VRQLAPLTAVYALAAALALPGSLAASDDPAPPETGRAEAAQAEPPVAPRPPSSAKAPQAEPAPLVAEAAPGAEATAGAEAPPAVEAPAAAEQPAGQEPPPASAPPVAQEPADAPAPVHAAQPGEQRAPAGARARASARRDRGNDREGRRRVATAAASTGVTIDDFAFSPSSVTIDVGDTVTWTNRDPTQHSATAEDGSFDTGLLRRGQSGSHTFDEAGTFRYVCTPHPNMKGTIIVRAASTGDSGSTTGESGSASGSGSGSQSSGATGSTRGSSSSGPTTTGTASGSESTLPATGADPATLAILGLLFLALGAAVQSRVRRA